MHGTCPVCRAPLVKDAPASSNAAGAPNVSANTNTTASAAQSGAPTSTPYAVPGASASQREGLSQYQDQLLMPGAFDSPQSPSGSGVDFTSFVDEPDAATRREQLRRATEARLNRPQTYSDSQDQQQQQSPHRARNNPSHSSSSSSSTNTQAWPPPADDLD